jgi:1-phosphofructokinase family hexose kinase
MIYTVTLNPAVDRELVVDKITFDTVLRASEWRVDCGGKGFNVARMLQSLGTASVALGFAAGKTGELLNEELQFLGIETGFIWVQGETRTNVTIVSADHSQYVKVNEPGPTISGDDLVKLMQKIQGLAQPRDSWVLAGSLPPGVPPSIYADMITILQSAGAQVFLDTSDKALRRACQANPFLIKPNAEEARELTGLPINTPAEIAAAGKAIQAIGAVNVIISLGKQGALLVNGQRAWLAASPEIVERNPIGAGDSMVAGLVWGLSLGYSMPEALCRGIACGAATASQSGTAVGSLAQVNELLTQVHLSEV